MAIPPQPIYLIEWVDSVQPTRNWQYIEDIEYSGGVKCRSVGFLLHDGDDCKVLAANVGAEGTESAQASGVVEIPTHCITRMVYMEEDQDDASAKAAD